MAMLMSNMGRRRADAARQQGNIWGSMTAGIGKNISQTMGQIVSHQINEPYRKLAGQQADRMESGAAGTSAVDAALSARGGDRTAAAGDLFAGGHGRLGADQLRQGGADRVAVLQEEATEIQRSMSVIGGIGRDAAHMTPDKYPQFHAIVQQHATEAKVDPKWLSTYLPDPKSAVGQDGKFTPEARQRMRDLGGMLGKVEAYGAAVAPVVARGVDPQVAAERVQALYDAGSEVFGDISSVDQFESAMGAFPQEMHGTMRQLFGFVASSLQDSGINPLSPPSEPDKPPRPHALQYKNDGVFDPNSGKLTSHAPGTGPPDDDEDDKVAIRAFYSKEFGRLQDEIDNNPFDEERKSTLQGLSEDFRSVYQARIEGRNPNLPKSGTWQIVGADGQPYDIDVASLTASQRRNFDKATRDGTVQILRPVY